MKKAFVLILTTILAFSYCGCGPSKFKIVTNMISSLPTTITLDSETAIVAAEEAYAELSDKPKLEVEGYGKLLDARVALDTIKIEESLKGEWVYTSYIDYYRHVYSEVHTIQKTRFYSTVFIQRPFWLQVQQTL